jgi:hypothetical protein
MILLTGPLLFVLPVLGAVRAKRAGRSGWEVGLIVAVGSLAILVETFGTLIWGFQNFG